MVSGRLTLDGPIASDPALGNALEFLTFAIVLDEVRSQDVKHLPTVVIC